MKDSLQCFYIYHTRSLNFITPLILGLSVVIFLWPFKYFIYGEGNLLFLNPFSYNISPLMQYHYSYSYSFPISDGAPYIFLDTIIYVLHFLTRSWIATEDFLILFISVIQSFGIFFMLSVVNNTRGKPLDSSFILKSLLTALYMFNPFSLSITWWSLQNWTFFYALCPVTIGICLEISFNKAFVWKHYLPFLLLLVVFVPGINGAFAVPFLYILLFFTIYIAFRSIFKDKNVTDSFKTSVKKIFLLFTPGLIVLLPAFLPYVFLPLGNEIAPGYVTKSNLITTFLIQSRTTQILHVLSLYAFNWLYFASATYPWMIFSSYMQDISYLIIFLFLISFFYIKNSRLIRLFLIFTFVPVMFSVGNNFPFGTINLFLIGLGGPFYIIINSYYIMGELYVASLIIIFFILYSYYEVKPKKFLQDHLQKSRNEHNDQADLSNWNHILKKPTHFYHKTNLSKYFKIFVVLALIILLTSYLYPVIATGEYTNNGPYSTEVRIPNSFYELKDYFDMNYTEPNFNVLVLPLSQNGVIYQEINNTAWQDSGQFLASFIPYPLLQANNSIVDCIINNFLSTYTYANLTLLFEYLHIKYIVMNPYYNESISSMTLSQNGNVFQQKQLSREFCKFFGRPHHIGSFIVYEVNNPTPIVIVDSYPMTSSSSLIDYIKFLGDINNSSNNLRSLLTTILLTNISMQHSSRFFYCRINSQTSNITIPINYTPYALFTNGTISNLTNYYTSPSSVGLKALNSTDISFSRQLILTQSSGIISNNFVNLSNKSLMSDSNNSCITSNRSVPENFSINIEFSSLNLTNNSHINVILRSNWLILMGQLFSSESRIYFSLVAFNNQYNPISWNTVILDNSLKNINNVDILLNYANGLFKSKINIENSSQISLIRVFPPFIENSNSGNNLSNLCNLSSIKPFKFRLEDINSNVTIHNLSVLQEPTIKYIMFIPNGKLSRIQPAKITITNDGNIHVSINNTKLENYYVIINFPDYQALWKSTPVGETISTNYSTLFYFSGPQKNISLFYSTSFIQGMWILILEIPTILSSYFVLIVVNGRKRYAKDRL